MCVASGTLVGHNLSRAVLLFRLYCKLVMVMGVSSESYGMVENKLRQTIIYPVACCLGWSVLYLSV